MNSAIVSYSSRPPSTPRKGGIDAVVVTADLNWEPSSSNNTSRRQFDAPDAANATVQLTSSDSNDRNLAAESEISIDWQTSWGPIHEDLYSINTSAMVIKDRIDGPEWPALIEYLQPRLLRLHSSGQNKIWVNDTKDGWNYQKVKESIMTAQLPENCKLMINIYRWPDSFDADEDGRLDKHRIDDFADFCADLVRYVNIELKQDVEYWEVTNERDFAYWRAPKANNAPDPQALADLYNRAANAMRRVDPSIKIGGPAACSPLPIAPLIEFAEHAKDNLDFFSFHAYASGNNSESDQVIYDKAAIIAEQSRDLADQLQQVMGDRTFGVHLNEYNICYNWRIPEPRMRNHKGAVFDALLLIHLSRVSGITAANAWNDTEPTYGKADREGNLRPGAHVYHYLNEYFQGDQVAAQSNNPDAVVPFAVNRPDGTQSFALVNRSGIEQMITLKANSDTPSTWYSATIDADGLHQSGPIAPFSHTFDLPVDSVRFFWQAAKYNP
ncbi:hypothetical protein QEH59_09450 [Coraliomargarita sp. SDUM461004]|uniref:Glycosyl hydrolases family 39 N-terminal catalytic domain-containing protein n=1 Tax=Thalassobacterium sedimentorum TaxID=3041258 RepID=A0ABU1AIL4_9BACT|nr:hypothetical protein [Coraliomargarita sp. SDUM461004]MDQ8194651.1 hypothetical protein [Coraliomargarita sp. SDUM461004]